MSLTNLLYTPKVAIDSTRLASSSPLFLQEVDYTAIQCLKQCLWYVDTLYHQVTPQPLFDIAFREENLSLEKPLYPKSYISDCTALTGMF